MKFLSIFLLIFEVTYAQYKNSYIYTGRSGIVQLFEWKFSDIATECQFLTENGYGAVHVSPVHESKIDDSYSWHLRYQPVSYKIKSRSGNVEDFKAMVQECTKHKIRVYVDVVANHMAKGDGEIAGIDKSTADPVKLEYPAVPYTHADFNENCEMSDESNAFQIRNCRLDGLPDLNLGIENVRERISDFMNVLIDYGVAGFRVDSVKHMWPMDLSNIYGRLKDLNTEYDFPPGSRPFIYQEVSDLGGEAVSKTEYTGMGLITEYLHSKELGLTFQGKKSMHDLLKWGPEKGFVPSKDAIVFVDNHDNQRNFVRGFTEILNFKDRRRYILANTFMLASPYGLPKIMSSFDFKDAYAGPPSDSNTHKIKSPVITEDGQCELSWIIVAHRMNIFSIIEKSIFINVCKV